MPTIIAVNLEPIPKLESYRAGKAFGSLLTEEDLATTLAKAEGVNSAMIDMPVAFQQAQGKKPLLDGGVVPFVKRDKKGISLAHVTAEANLCHCMYP